MRRLRGPRPISAFVLVAALAAVTLVPPARAADDGAVSADMQRFRATHPAVRILLSDDLSVRVYGTPLAQGVDASVAAESFRLEQGAIFGVPAGQIAAPSDGTARVQPLVYRPERDDYAFDLVRYEQRIDGVAVYDAALRLLSRNEPGHPVVWAQSTLRDLGEFRIDPTLRAALSEPQFVDERFAAARQDALRRHPALSRFGGPRSVIWAGSAVAPEPPRVALVFQAGDPAGKQDRSLLFIADLSTGAIVHEESLIVRSVVDGNVSGLATTGIGADICGEELPTPLPWLLVHSTPGSAFSDAAGDYSIADGGATIDATLDGEWFDVFTVQGTPASASGPSSFDLEFNPANNDEFVRAQVNAYVEANRVRDLVLRHNPDYPTFDDTDIAVYANRTDGFCPGNAWYDPGDGSSPTGYSLNFCASSSDRANTGFSSVVHHEFGHHVVRAGGSGQGAYGEGMGDVMSVLTLDDPRLGFGFFNNCTQALRNADNTLQYPCSGASHFCGQLISGAVWDTRMKLVGTRPFDYRDILADLAINAVLMHSGSGIGPGITIDYLVLDDDDANLFNGTPHYAEINSGFGLHSMPGPARVFGLGVSPDSKVVVTGGEGGPFAPQTVGYTLINGRDVAVPFEVLSQESWVSVSPSSGVIPPQGSLLVTATLDPTAGGLSTGIYRDDLVFVDGTDPDGALLRPIELQIGAQQFPSAVAVPIPKARTVVDSVQVADSFCVGDVNVGVDIVHPSTNVLEIELGAPDGTTVRLHDRGPGDGLVRTYDDESGVPADGPGSLADFRRLDAAGEWTLTILNDSFTYGGILNGWTLDLTPYGAVCPPLAQSGNVTVRASSQTEIALEADAAPGAELTFTVTALPAIGRLDELDGTPIDAVPHVLSSASGGHVVYEAPGGFLGVARIGFRVATAGVESDPAEVTVHVGTMETIAQFDLSDDPGWSTTGSWGYGQPAGGGTHGGDPTSGFTGAAVYGYALDGDYADQLAPETLTSTPIDCSGHVGIEVAFRRWLGVEDSTFDHAAFQASPDGVIWTTVWEHDGATLDETAWSEQVYDLSAIADGEPALRLRWVMGDTDLTGRYAGWNLDDVVVSGIVPPRSIELTVAPSALNWSTASEAIAYDVVRGELTALRAGAGDFTAATDACLAAGVVDPSLAETDVPPAGEGFWYLVQGVSAAGGLGYETFTAAQDGLRDAEIAASASSCP